MSEIDEEVETKIEELVEEIMDIHEDITESTEHISYRRSGNKTTWGFGSGMGEIMRALSSYENWYNKALPLISDYLPDRKEDFKHRYRDVRSCLELDLGYIKDEEITGETTLKMRIQKGVMFQADLLKSIRGRIETQRLKATEKVSKDIVSDEVQKARGLFDDDHIRAAGVIAGVAIERHLITLCESSPQEIKFGYMDGITTLAQTLSDAGEITDDEQRLLEYLAGIRNKCSHASDEEPEKTEVERMLDETNDFIRS